MQAEIANNDIRATLRARGICVVIPTYNNVGTIADVVRRTLHYCDDVIVVCDGCTDGTREAVEAITGVTLVAYEQNAGKGTALKHGFRKALDMGFAYAITLDADGQHFPEDIPLLLKANQENPGALIVGSRKALETMERSKGSKFANAFSNFWFCVQTWTYLEDTQTGYRLYPLRKLRGLSMLTSRYEAELELMVFASWHGVNLISTPVNVYYPPREQRVSHFRPAKDFTRITILNTCLCFLSILYALPLRVMRGLLVVLRTVYSLLFYLFFTLIVMTPFAVVYLHVGKDDERKRYGLHCMLYAMTKFLMKVHGIPGVQYKLNNPHGEDFSKPAVLVCNHQSHLDLMTLLSLNRKIVVLTNDWVWHSPFFGYIIRQAEFYPVSMGIDELMPKLQDLVRRGYSIAIYPEGTRSEDCSIGRFHKGAFHIAESLGIDIVPLVLYGAGKVLRKKGHVMKKGIIRLDIDQRISSEQFQSFGTTLRTRTSWMRAYYVRRYNEMCNETEQYV